VPVLISPPGRNEGRFWMFEFSSYRPCMLARHRIRFMVKEDVPAIRSLYCSKNRSITPEQPWQIYTWCYCF
jgi:hypothetical protein